MTTTYTVDAITERFPNPSTPKIEGQPTFKTIKEVEKLLDTNSTSVQSKLGGGAHDYLGLTKSSEKHNTVTGHDFNAHANPEAIPTFPANASQHQIAQANASHKEGLRLWREQQVVEKPLKNQLTGAIESKFIADLHNTHTQGATPIQFKIC